SDPVLVAERLDGDDLLPRGDLAADDPVERAAEEDFLGPLRHHPRDVDMALRQTLFLCSLHPFGDPFLQFFDGIAANGELENVEWHDRYLAIATAPINRRMSPAPARLGEAGLAAAERLFSPPASSPPLEAAVLRLTAEPGFAARRPGTDAPVPETERLRPPTPAAASLPCPARAS